MPIGSMDLEQWFTNDHIHDKTVTKMVDRKIYNRLVNLERNIQDERAIYYIIIDPFKLKKGVEKPIKIYYIQQ